MTKPRSETRCVLATIEGQVQGVGFRFWCQREASKLGLDGWVRNCRDGRVNAQFHGPANAIDEMQQLCNDGPRWAEVTRLYWDDVQISACEGQPPGFHILSSH